MGDLFSRFNTDYFFKIPVESKIVYFWLVLYGVFFIGTLIIYFIFRKKGKTEKPYLPYSKKLLWTDLTISAVGLILVFARYEKLNIYSWRFWQTITFVCLIAANIWLVLGYKKLKQDLLRFKASMRKEKWLKKKNKRRIANR
ncbi:MAG: hypothetical protein WC437_03280 [Patescibacteria group bacterium]|jgi:nicotinamide riboside transporter PnuC